MIALVNPPNPPHAVSNKDTMGGLGQLYQSGAKHSMSPLDMAYTAAVLRRNNVPVDVIDCLGRNWGLDELILRIHQENPELVAIRTSTPSFDWDMRVSEIIKEVTNSKIIVFGPHVTFFSGEILKLPFVDAIVDGEPELTFLDIAERGGFRGCEGVLYKEDGTIVQNTAREPVGDLDGLPFPAWDMMPYHAYDGGALMRNIKPFVTVLTSRGCPHGCAYCPYPVTQGRKLRVRSPENVVDELEWLEKRLGVKAVLFRDPEFALCRDRVVRICEGILKRGLGLVWRCETRMDDIDEELVTLMARAGCIGVNMGLESASEKVLRNMKRKAIPLEQAIKVVRTCRKSGIETFCFFILGLPGETKEDAFKTINYALKLKPHFVQFTTATPYPGTELRQWAENRGFIENKSLDALTGYEVVIRNECMTVDEIRSLQRFAYESWEMQWCRVVKRVLVNACRAGSEIKRWLRFQGIKVEKK